MKKIFQYSLLAAGMTLALSSCEDMFGDFLDKEPSNVATTDEVYSDWLMAVQAHTDTYNFFRHGACRINNSWLDAATDLAATSYATGGVRTTFNIGNYYGGGGAPELTGTWEHYYRGIRKCNQTIANIYSVPKSADLSQERYEILQAQYTAEARFLRAFFYWELFLRYGPVPLVTEVLDPDGDLLSGYTERPTVREYVVDFVLRELKECEADLLDCETAKGSAYAGEISQPMARALYGRIMMYMASPRYAEASGITWRDALAANDSFLADFGGSYALMQVSSSAPTFVDALTTVWLNTQYAENNTEVIFYRNDVNVGWGAIVNDVNVGEGGNGGCCPSQNLIDMYDMADGTAPFTAYDVTGAPVYSGLQPSVNAASGYTDQTMWENRDPRLAAAVLYHGVAWGTGTGANAYINVISGMRDNPIGNANATPTGYYLRKYIPASILSAEHSGSSRRLWTFIRYAEILLNRAEILNEISYDDNRAEICSLLDQIRHRAGITGYVADRADLGSQTAMRNFIHKERTVEFAFEEHRWWDVRRWNCAVEALSRPIYGIEVAADGRISRKVAQNRVFDAKMYLYPIPETEYWKTGIENNAGW